MSKAVARKPSVVELGLDAHASPSALILDSEIAEERWAEIGATLGRLSSASAWWVGDWVRYGDRKWGERYDDAAEITGLDKGTLRNYAYIARRFDSSYRYDTLGIRHHALVAAMGDADAAAWLERAADEGWSAQQLAQEIRGTRELPPPADLEWRPIRLRIISEREERWRQAAEHDGVPLEDWIVDTVDRHAAETLDGKAA